MTTSDPDKLTNLLKTQQGLEHLGVRKSRNTLVIYSGSQDDINKHARLISRGPGLWQLSLPKHTGRWENTPFVGTMDEVFDTLLNTLGFHLAPR